MKLLKRTICLCLCGLLLLGLYGCTGKELYERLLIHGIGVDLDGELFSVSVRSNLSPEDEGEEFFTCRGRSVLEALNSLSLSTGRDPFCAHNYLVVFGREAAERGLDSCLDFFIRYYNTRPAVELYLAEGRAEDVLGAKREGSLVRMSELQQLSGKNSDRAVSVELLDFVNGAAREGSSPMLPVVRATEERGLEVVSTAYFQGSALKGFLTLDETRGWLAAKGKLDGGEAVLSGEGLGRTTVSLTGCGGSAEASLRPDGTPEFLLRVQVRGDVSSVDGADRAEAGFYHRAEAELAALVQEEIESALEKTVRQDRCDVFGFGDLLYRQEPGFWRAHGEDWPELMARCGCRVEVSARVDRLEQGTPPQTLDLDQTR